MHANEFASFELAMTSLKLLRGREAHTPKLKILEKSLGSWIGPIGLGALACVFDILQSRAEFIRTSRLHLPLPKKLYYVPRLFIN
jgi:hypothetical protein